MPPKTKENEVKMVGRGSLVLKSGNGDIHKSKFPITKHCSPSSSQIYASCVCFFLKQTKETDPVMYNNHNSFCKAILISRTAKGNSLRNTVITLP